MIDGDQYVERICSVKKQFELVRIALCEFKNDQGRLDSIAKKEIAGFARMMRNLLRKSQAVETEPMHELDRTNRERTAAAVEYVENIGREAIAKFVNEIDDALNRVNQNELILLVTLFEIQMKDIHREVLRQEPSLLNSERLVPLGKVISGGAQSVVDLEIEREVQSLDRKNVFERAKYFNERLRLDWTECTEIELVAEVIEARNQILHEDPGMTVTSEKIEQVVEVSLAVPFHCCSVCVKRYPAAFHQAPYEVYAEAAKVKLYSDEDWTPPL